MSKKKVVRDIVADSISRLTIPYIEKYGEKILAVYLCPYQIGGFQKIEIVILHGKDEEIPIKKKSILVNELKIYVNANTISNYSGSIDCEKKERAAKELKSSFILYDPRKILTNKKNSLKDRDDISMFHNSFELPNEVVKNAKSKVYLKSKTSNKSI